MRIVGDENNNLLNGTSGDDEIYGLDGNDFIRCGVGNDMVDGGSGDDQLFGDAGIDVLYGGNGRDLIYAGDANDEVYGQDGADQLDGMAGDDELYGGGGADRLNGRIGVDQLYGDAGNDILSGDAGADLLYGGDGIDTLDYGSSEAGVTIDLSAGTASGGDAAGDRYEGIENVVGSSLDDVLTGSASTSRLEGGGGADQLTIGAANSVLLGGDGYDSLRASGVGSTLDGGTGNDTLQAGDRATILAGDGSDLVTVGSFIGLSADGGAGLDKIAISGGVNVFYMGTGVGYDSAGQVVGNAKGFESVEFAPGGNLRVVGTGGVDTIHARGGNVTLIGGAGDDVLSGGVVLFGGVGAGIFQGGAGADRMTGFYPDSGGSSEDLYFDYLSYETSSAGVSVDMITGKGFGGDAQGDIFSSMNGILGSQYGDTLRGASGNNSLYGMVGADIIIGGGGHDRLIGGAGADKFVYESVNDSRLNNSADLVTDFSRAQFDRIDLSAIDANAGLAGNQAFSFIGTALYSGIAGQLRYVSDGVITTIAGDINGDKVSDFQIKLTGAIGLAAGDFIL